MSPPLIPATRPFAGEEGRHNVLKVRRIGIDTYQEPVIYMRHDCHICRSEGFEAQSRITVQGAARSIVATLNVVATTLLGPDEAGLSEAAWHKLSVAAGEEVRLSHARPLESFSAVRGKIYGNPLSEERAGAIIRDVIAGLYSDIEMASFITACAGDHLDVDEITGLTRAMINAGSRLSWKIAPIVDKHCVGGLPGNRTTLLVVPIVAACGLTISKTSSRAITSPAGTADTMETLAPVELSMAEMQSVVAREGGCIVWGGSVNLSPADDILIRVERPLDLDSSGQLVASVLSKKAAAGATHVLIDIPVGPTAKVRSREAAQVLGTMLTTVGRNFGLQVRTMLTDGSQPVGRGVGPALEARDVLAVLRNESDGPSDLRDRALLLAGGLLELGGAAGHDQGESLARSVLESGRALRKLEAICEAQGGMREPPKAPYSCVLTAERPGIVRGVDNRRLARIAKLAGAPKAPAAGLDFHARPGSLVRTGEPLLTLHAQSPGELAYARAYAESQPDVIMLGEGP